MSRQSTSRSCASTLALFILIVTGADLHAQQPGIRPYQSEEDLWESLSEGEISFDEFIELLDLHRAGVDTLFVPESDWEQLPGSQTGYLAGPDSSQAISAPSAGSSRGTVAPFGWSIRGGYDADLISPVSGDGYTVARLDYNQLRALLDWSQDDASGGRWRRRTLAFEGKFLSAQIGSIEPRWGRGLVIGRRSRVVTTAESPGTFAQPTRGRFNGLQFRSKEQFPVVLEGLASDVRSGELTDRVVAMQLSARYRHLSAGLSALAGKIERRDNRATFNERVIGGWSRIGHRGREILAELAINDRAATAKAVEAIWPLSKGRVHGRFWAHGKDFSNPWGGGPGHVDTRMIALDSAEASFSSRTAGERGFNFITRLQVSPVVALRWDWMSHREEPGAPLQHQAVVRAQIRHSGLSLTPFIRGRIDDAGAETFSFGSYASQEFGVNQLDARFEFGRHYSNATQFIRVGLGGKWQLNRVVRFAPAIRWNDPNLDVSGDGYWYAYFTETMIPMAGFRLEAALVWKNPEDSGGDDLVELRIRIFVR